MSKTQTGEQLKGINRGTGQRFLRPLILLAVIACLAGLAHVFDWGARLYDIRHWIHSFGAGGYALFVLIYILATIAVIPGAILTVIAGTLFGSVLGVILVSIASTVGASLAFLIARYFARDAVTRWLSGNETFRRLDEMTARHGAVIVAIVRLIPLFPFDIVNYGFGLTAVPFSTYVLWSWLCMLPATILYVTGADAFTRGISGGALPWPLIGFFVAAAAMLLLLIHYAHKILKKKEADHERQA